MADGNFWQAASMGGGIITATLADAFNIFQPARAPKSYNPLKQPIPPRHFAYGRGRKPGVFVYYASVAGYTLDVQAFCHGRIAGDWQFYFHDDPITLNGDGTSQSIDGRYGDMITVKSRLGEPTETAFDHIIEKAEGTWTTNHRGDFTASVGMRCRMVTQEKMPKVFPNQQIELSATADWLCVYDWRDPAQDRDDPATWQWSENPIVCQVHDEWAASNYPLWSNADTALAEREKALADRIWARRFEPVLDLLTEEADACDELVALAAGGTVNRYTCFVWYDADTDRKTVREKFKRACDGWRAERSDGAMVIRCGRWVLNPTPITASMIVDIDNLSAGIPKSRLVNELQVRFRSPDHLYEVVDTIAWTDEDSISRRGRKSAALELDEVTNNSQARRLGKARFYALNAAYSGEIVLDLDSLPENFFEYRYHTLELDEGPTAFQSMYLEIVRSEIDLLERTVTVAVRSANPNMYEWDAATEEGANPGVIVSPSPGALITPTISSVTPVFEDLGAGTGVRLTIEGSGPDRDDLTWFAAWRVAGAVSWSESQYTDAAAGPPVELLTGFVTASPDIEVRIAYSTGAAELSDWSTAFDVDASVAPPEEEASLPSGLDAFQNGPDVEVSFSITADHGRVFRGSSTDAFVDATDISGELPATPGVPISFTDTAPAPGGYRYWAVAETAADLPSDPAGPVAVTVV